MGLDNPLHVAFLVVILLLVFGARRLPEIGRSLGSGMREFKDSITGDSHQQTLTPGPQPPQAVAQPTQAAAQPAAEPATTEATAPTGADAPGA
jgi:sec-independent protein translocase protein TatA